jgi:hypothetical protein
VHYGLQSGAYTASLDVGLVTTTTVAGLSSGQTYYFAVTAYDRTDGVESAVSNEVSAMLPPSGSPAPPPPNGSPAPGGLITLEAEAMALTGYLVEQNADASGEALISRRGAAGAPPGRATAAFPGPASTYDIIVTYFDENDGQSMLTLQVHGQVVDTWLADADLSDSVASAVTLPYWVAAHGLSLAPGNVIALEGYEQGGEYARVDEVDFWTKWTSCLSAVLWR